MSRKTRIFRANNLHHVMFRGVNGQNIFLDNQDRIRICLLLQEVSEKHGLGIHGYCFMNNHIHLILEPIKQLNETLISMGEPIKQLKDLRHPGVHALAFRYAQYFNRRHERKGYLFQGRFRSILVDDESYLKGLIRYIHLNPVEAKIVSRPEQYLWSSYRGYLGLDECLWLRTDRVLRGFGESKPERIENFITHTHNRMDVEFNLETIHKAIRSGVYNDEESSLCKKLQAQNEEIIEVQQTIVLPDKTSLDDIIIFICRHFQVTFEDLSSPRKDNTIVNARSVLALIVKRSRKWTLENVSRILNKNSGSLSKLASRAEQCPILSSFVDKFNP